MLDLLDLHNAILLLLKRGKKIENNWESLEPKDYPPEYYYYRINLISAIEAGLLPAVTKEYSSKENKNAMAAVDIPENIQEHIPKKKIYWVSSADLVVFAEGTPRDYTGKGWSHSRRSTAKLCYLMARKLKHVDDMNSDILQLVEDAGEEELNIEALGETTIKNCVVEICEAGKSMKR